MFTGIIQTQAKVAAISVANKATEQAFKHIVIETQPQFLQQLQIGASIAINGCCLTAVEFSDTQVHFDVIDETLRLTNLGELNIGDAVNLERSLKMGDEIGGHHVSGHIHDTVVVERVEQTSENFSIWLRFQPKWQRYIFAKGFIAVNGASLTVGQVEDNCFSLHLIPETLRLTNIANAKPGDRLNMELDQQSITIVDTVERVLAQRGVA